MAGDPLPVAACQQHEGCRADILEGLPVQASGSRRLQSEGKRAPHSYHQPASELPLRTSELTAGSQRGGRTPSREGLEEHSAWVGGLLSL